MTFIQLPGKDSIVDLKNDPKLYYIVLVGALLTTITFALTKDILTLVFLILTTATIFFALNRPPKDIIVSLTNTDLQIGDVALDWVNVDSWAAGSAEAWLEISIKTTHLTKPYFTFYIPQGHPLTQNFLILFSERASYDDTVISHNWLNNTLKQIGLR